MPSMSYCRFENTLSDMKNCLTDLSERVISSDREKRAANSLLLSVLAFLDEEGIIEGYNAVRVAEIMEQCKEEQDEEPDDEE